MGTHDVPKVVDVLNSVTSLNRTPMFEWYVVWYGSKNGYQKTCVLKRLDCVLEKIYDIYFMLSTPHNGGNLYDLLINTRIFTLIMNEMFI